MNLVIRKILLWVFLGSVACPGFAFGHLGSLYIRSAHKTPLPNKRYLSYKFAYKQEITFCTEEPSSRKRKGLLHEDLAQYFQVAFWEWTRGTALYLRRSGRAEEFADVIALLSKPFRLTYLGPCKKDMPRKPDIELRTDSCSEQKTAQAYYTQTGHYGGGSSICFLTKKYSIPRKLIEKENKQNKKYFQSVLSGALYNNLLEKKEEKKFLEQYYDGFLFTMMHETGHAFGLADEYARKEMRFYQRSGGAIGFAPLPPSGVPGLEAFSTPYAGEGLMNGFLGKRTADEVMGLITVFDRLLEKERIIYPLLADKEKPVIGAIVNGNYVFAPLKKGANASRLYKKYFQKFPFTLWILERKGDKVFEREFDPLTGESLKSIKERQKKALADSLREIR